MTNAENVSPASLRVPAAPSAPRAAFAVRQAVFQGVVWSAAQKWGARATSLVTFVVLGRLLEPAEFGLVGAAAALLAVLGIFSEFGASTYLIQHPACSAKHVHSVFWAGCGLALGLIGALLVLAGPIESALDLGGLAEVVRLSSALLLLNALGAVPTALLRRDLRFKALAVRALCATFGASLVAIALAVAGQGVWALVGQQLAYGFISVWMLWRATSWRPRWQFGLGAAREVFGYGSKIAAGNLVGQVPTQGVVLIIGAVLGPAALGLYTVATRLTLTFIDLFSSVFSSATASIFARMKEDEAGTARLYERAVTVSNGSAAVLLGLLAGTAGTAIPLLFGAKWIDAAPVAAVVAFGAIVSTATYYDRNILLAAGRPGRALLVTSIDAALTVAVFAVFAAQADLLTAVTAKAVINVGLWGVYLRSVTAVTAVSTRRVAGRVFVHVLIGGVVVLASHSSTVFDAMPPGWALVLDTSAGVVVGVGLLLLTSSLIRHELGRARRGLARRPRKPGTTGGPT